IVIDAATRTILDGHHRHQALRSLGCMSIPAFAVDYSDPSIRVGRWRKGVAISKEDVLRASLSRKILPPKTSRHFFPFFPARVDTPLRALRK
ncbi:MAG: transcriptional regulator, partial [Aigarchaeota archaeon]|nr:transcriptional regulator [Aigarchaeota archaeon]